MDSIAVIASCCDRVNLTSFITFGDMENLGWGSMESHPTRLDSIATVYDDIRRLGAGA
jgi:hypothetical protein